MSMPARILNNSPCEVGSRRRAVRGEGELARLRLGERDELRTVLAGPVGCTTSTKAWPYELRDRREGPLPRRRMSCRTPDCRERSVARTRVAVGCRARQPGLCRCSARAGHVLDDHWLLQRGLSPLARTGPGASALPPRIGHTILIGLSSGKVCAESRMRKQCKQKQGPVINQFFLVPRFFRNSPEDQRFAIPCR